MPLLSRFIARTAFIFTMFAAGLAQAAPENGWWWNPTESGRGFFIEIAGTQVYMAGYFYESDGRATWLVSQGQTTTTSYAGRLLSFAGGQTLFGDYHPPGPAADAGAVSLEFTDDRHAVLTWPGGTLPIERQTFGTAPAAIQPLTGWWWNDAESGRGYSIEVQGDQLFLVSFMYDDAGAPLWYFAAGTLATPTHFEGQLLQFSAGQTLTGPYKPPGPPSAIGTIAVDFTAPDEATLTVTERAAARTNESAAKAGRSKLITIKPQLPRIPPLKLPEAWEGTFNQNLHTRIEADGVVIDSSAIITGNATWVQDLFLGTVADYVLLGSVKINYNYSLNSAAINCTGTELNTYVLNGADGTLLVNSDGTYTGNINRAFSFPASVTCTTVAMPNVPSTSVTHAATNVANLVIAMKGNVVYLRLNGQPTPVHPSSGTTLGTSWDFHAK